MSAEMKVDMGGEQKPMVTAEEYAAARAVLDALPSGVYVKCADCLKWKHNGTFAFRMDGVICEECGGAPPVFNTNDVAF